VYVNTRFGRTHILKMGKQNGLPIIAFHGGNSLNPHDLLPLVELAKDYQIYAPDTIGHPGYSDEIRLSSKNMSYGEWALDIIDQVNYPHLKEWASHESVFASITKEAVYHGKSVPSM